MGIAQRGIRHWKGIETKTPRPLPEELARQVSKAGETRRAAAATEILADSLSKGCDELGGVPQGTTQQGLLAEQKEGKEPCPCPCRRPHSFPGERSSLSTKSFSPLKLQGTGSFPT